MKSGTKWMGILFLLVLFNASAAAGADVTAAVDVNSAYVWRGITFNDGIVAQPNLDVASGGFDLNVWANYDIDDYDGALDKYEFSEVDLTMSYTYGIGPVDLTGGITEYLYPTTESGGEEATQEVFLDVSGEPVEGLSIGLTGNYDFDEVDDFYVNPHIEYALDFGEGFSMDMGASCGIVGQDFSKYYSGGTDGGFHEYTLTLGGGYTVDAYSFNTHIGYTNSFDDEVLPDPDVNFFGGAGVEIAF